MTAEPVQQASPQNQPPIQQQLSERALAKKPHHAFIYFGFLMIGIILGTGATTLFFSSKSPEQQITTQEPMITPTPQQAANPSSTVFNYPLKDYPVAGAITAETSVPVFIHDVTAETNGSYTISLANDTGDVLSDTITINDLDNMIYFYDPVEDIEKPIQVTELVPGDKVELLFSLSQETLNWELTKLRKLEK